METTGHLAPADPEAARSTYEELAEPATVVATAAAKAMGVADPSERVGPDVVATTRDALFGSILEVRVGSREAYEAWRSAFDGEVVEAGSEHVDNVAWHAFDGRAVAATYQDERDAAVATLRRQAFNRLYRRLFYGEAPEEAEGDGPEDATGEAPGDPPAEAQEDVEGDATGDGR